MISKQDPLVMNFLSKKTVFSRFCLSLSLWHRAFESNTHLLSIWSCFQSRLIFLVCSRSGALCFSKSTRKRNGKAYLTRYINLGWKLSLHFTQVPVCRLAKLRSIRGRTFACIFLWVLYNFSCSFLHNLPKNIPADIFKLKF